MSLQLEAAVDIGLVTFNNIKRDIQYTLDHNDYPNLNKLFSGRDVDKQTGKQIERHISLGRTGNARHKTIDENDTTDVKQLMKNILVPWKHADTSYGYYVQEALVQNGPEGFISVVKNRKTNMWIEFADELEEASWLCPADATDITSPFGISYWLPLGAAAAEGFEGRNPYYLDGNEITGGAGGIADAAAVAHWRSYYAQYTTVDWDDLVEKLDVGFRKTKFRAPATVEEGQSGPLSMFRMYTNNNVLKAMTSMLLLADDKVGYDLGKYHGAVVFNRLPFMYVDILDADGSGYDADVLGEDTVFGVNWNFFEAVVLKGDNFRQTPPAKDADNHNFIKSFVDLTYNYVCLNRRYAGFNISKTGK